MTTSTGYIITSCQSCGCVKETADYESARLYVAAALACRADYGLDPAEHMRWHQTEGHSCWTQCPDCVIDPEGIFD